MAVLYFTFVGKGKSKADVPIMEKKEPGNWHILEWGKKGSAFIKAGLCGFTAGMQEVDLMWCFVNLYNLTVSV